MHRWLKMLRPDAPIGYETDTQPRNPHSDHHSAHVDRFSPIRF